MEFEGLIVSDALDMGALAGSYSQEEIAVRAWRQAWTSFSIPLTRA